MTAVDYRSGLLAVALMVLVMLLQLAFVPGTGFALRDVATAGGGGAVALLLAYGIERVLFDREPSS